MLLPPTSSSDGRWRCPNDSFGWRKDMPPTGPLRQALRLRTDHPRVETGRGPRRFGVGACGRRPSFQGSVDARFRAAAGANQTPSTTTPRRRRRRGLRQMDHLGGKSLGGSGHRPRLRARNRLGHRFERSFGFARTNLPHPALADLSATSRADTPANSVASASGGNTVFDSRPADRAGDGSESATCACLNANPRKDRAIRCGNAANGNELKSGAKPWGTPSV